MKQNLILRNRYQQVLFSWSHSRSVLLFLLLFRIALNIPALIGANWFPLREWDAGFGREVLTSFPGVWARWDTGYYMEIANRGYSFQGEELAFFPAYPLLINFFSFDVPLFRLWVAYGITNLAFVIAAFLLWQQIHSEFNTSIAWTTLITLNVFPTSFFFSALYTESLFFLFAILVYWFSVRRQYFLAGLFVSAASLTRINGILLITLPIVEILINRPNAWLKRIVVTGSLSVVGLVFYGLYLWITQGHPLAFVFAQGHWKRAIVWPWQTVLNSAGIAFFGYGGFENNWFMRVVSLQDLLAALLFIACTVLAFFLVRKSLFFYAVASMLLFLISEGPYTLGLWSMSRFVLVVFPGFIVLGILLNSRRRLKWGIWIISLMILLFLTAWFTNGRWVA